MVFTQLPFFFWEKLDGYILVYQYECEVLTLKEENLQYYIKKGVMFSIHFKYLLMFIFQSLYRKPENRFLIYNPVCFILTGDF